MSDFVNLVDNIDFATYTTSEQAVGTWIDGKTIYRKVIDTGMVSRSTLNPYNTGITISHLINAEGYWLNGSNSQQMAFGNTLAIDGGIIQTTRAFASNEGVLNIQFIQVGGTAPSQVQIVVALYYTKTS